MAQQLFEALFIVCLFGLALAPFAGLLFVLWPRKTAARRYMGAGRAHARI